MRKLTESKKKSKGTHRAKRETPTPAPKKVDNILPSGTLSAKAQAEWDLIAAELTDLHMLSNIDKKLLMAYCTEMAKYWDYSAKLNDQSETLELKSAKGQVIGYMKNPLCDLADKALKAATTIGAHFGLTPLSRTKINLPQKPKEETPEAKAEREYTDILNRKKKAKQIQMQAS